MSRQKATNQKITSQVGLQLRLHCCHVQLWPSEIFWTAHWHKIKGKKLKSILHPTLVPAHPFSPLSPAGRHIFACWPSNHVTISVHPHLFYFSLSTSHHTETFSHIWLHASLSCVISHEHQLKHRVRLSFTFKTLLGYLFISGPFLLPKINFSVSQTMWC